MALEKAASAGGLHYRAGSADNGVPVCLPHHRTAPFSRVRNRRHNERKLLCP